VLILDVNLSPLPVSARVENSERGSRTGRKLVRVHAARCQEDRAGGVLRGRTAETLMVL